MRDDAGAAWVPTTEEDQDFLDFRDDLEKRDELRFVGMRFLVTPGGETAFPPR